MEDGNARDHVRSGIECFRSSNTKRVLAFDVDSAFCKKALHAPSPTESGCRKKLNQINVMAIEKENNATFGSHLDFMILLKKHICRQRTI